MTKMQFPEGEGPLLKVNELCSSGARKFDGGKPCLSRVPRAGLEGLAEVMAFGAEKYGWDNWKQGMDWSRLLDAALRHLYKFTDGQDKDEESGLNHLSHAACNIFFLIHYYEKGLGRDNRSGD
jgi:hypothetical protein